MENKPHAKALDISRRALLACSASALVAACSSSLRNRILNPAVVSARYDDKSQVRARFVLDIDGASEYRVFTLRHPDRVVLDLSHTDWIAPPSRTLGTVAHRYRTGRPRPGITRVVLDLRTAGLVEKVFTLPGRRQGQTRLVVDIRQSSKHEMLEAELIDHSGKIGNYRDQERRPTFTGRPLIFLDAGHGGKDPGAIGLTGTHEKDVVLAVAKRVASHLRNSGLVDVGMTRTTDRFIELPDRPHIAIQHRATVLLSIHADSAPRPEAQGATVYVRRNTPSYARSRALAVHLRDHILTVAPMVERPIRTARLAVLGYRAIPASALVELGFLSNAADERALRSEAYRERIAQAIADGVLTHIRQVPAS